MSELPSILYQEEATNRGHHEDKNDILTKIHNDALETQALTRIVSKVAVPLYEHFESRFTALKERIRVMKAIKKELLES